MKRDDIDEATARMIINHGEILLDAGAILDALDAFQSALALSKDPRNQQEALLAQANVLGWFLDEPAMALKLYQKGMKLFPGIDETLRYRAAMLMFEAGNESLAKQQIADYQRRYPDGRHRFQLEGVLKYMARGRISAPSAATPAPLPIMKVGLSKGVKRFSATSPEGTLCVDGLGCSRHMDISVSGNDIVVNGKRMGDEFTIPDNKPITVEIRGKKKTILGSLKTTNQSGRLVPVNHIDIESYLRSVVPAECYASWPLETLKAQAVAARSYAYFLNTHGGSNGLYHLLSDERSQMYAGITRHTPSSDKAISETAGMVLTHEGKVAFTQYSAHSGGVTADSKAVFNAYKPYLISHPDPISMETHKEVWSKQFSLKEIEKRLRRKGYSYTNIRKIEPARFGPSRRVVAVRIHHSRGATVINTRISLLWALGLKEILMDINRTPDGYEFKGAGYGHGVGMSQWGACGMGKTHTHSEILAFYYPGTQLKRLWN